MSSGRDFEQHDGVAALAQSLGTWGKRPIRAA